MYEEVIFVNFRFLLVQMCLIQLSIVADEVEHIFLIFILLKTKECLPVKSCVLADKNLSSEVQFTVMNKL